MTTFYLAPLEGITGYIFRNAVLDIFPEGIEKVYAPFIMPHVKVPMSKKDIEDIGPCHNKHGKLIPQILTNDPEGFKLMEKAMRDYGYNEINLNLGCPSKTVTVKGRGSGFLSYPDALDDFLYRIYENAGGPISIKTRLGGEDPEEFCHLLEIYNKYPVYELTVHPRIRTQGYNGTPYKEFYYYALKYSTNPVCYNGDIYSEMDLRRLIMECPNDALQNQSSHEKEGIPEVNSKDAGSFSHKVMIGRGMIRNPGLIRELTTGRKLTRDELSEFLTRIRKEYSAAFSGDTPVLQKLKEIWAYMRMIFPESERDVKKMLKCRTLAEYSIYENKILSEFKPDSTV